MSERKVYVSVDVDSTIIYHTYPELGQPIPGALEWLYKFQELGFCLILNTMRSCFDSAGDTLTPVVKFLQDKGIKLYGINRNPDQDWSKSPKVYAHFYIDDAAVGCPLTYPLDGSRAYVDWNKVGEIILKEYKIMKRAK